MYPIPLVVPIKPSRQSRRLLAALHFLAGASLLLANLPVLAQTAGTAILATSLALHFRSGPNTAFRCKSNGEMDIRINEFWQAAEWVAYRVVTPVFTLIRFRQAGSAHDHRLVLFPDTMPGEDYRRLRVWIRWLGIGSEVGANASRHNLGDN